MAVRTMCRKATFFSFFLLAVVVSEYFMVVHLQRSLPVGEEAQLGRGGPFEHSQGGGGWRALRGGEDRRRGEGGKDEEKGWKEPEEVRLARELHDLRLDRLKNFEHRTGSLLADQQRRNSENRLMTLKEKEQQSPHQMDSLYLDMENLAKNSHQLREILNLSRIVDEILHPEESQMNKGSQEDQGDEAVAKFKGNDGHRLKKELDKLYNIYTRKNKKETKEEEEEEKDYSDYTELHRVYGSEEEEEEEDEDYKRVFDPDDFIITLGADGRVNVSKKPLGPEILVENMTIPDREFRPTEKDGHNILLSIRTTESNHRKRLPLLFETWLTEVDTSQVFLVTDGDDPFTRLWTTVKGMHYVNAKCGNSYSREQLCCKAGAELSLLLQDDNKAFDWICHVDDDMYLNMKNLVSLLLRFDPLKEPVYLGRSGSAWESPRRVKMKAKLSKPGKKYHFAVGGLYCLSRAMLYKTMDWIGGGEAFSKTCSLTKEPEDVTIGLVVGMLNLSLSRTEKIYTHGLHLATTVDPYTLTDQVAFSYGYGSVRWGEDPYNAVYVPGALFSLEEDDSQFRSLHCLLYPDTSWCVRRKQLLGELRADDDAINYDYSDDKKIIDFNKNHF